MSCQKGNTWRTRSQKYMNATAYRNSLHDTSKRTHEINNLTMEALCARCKGILEWKVKYKKYKPLSQPTVCRKCKQKTVKRAYYKFCIPCIEALGICGKCGAKAELVIPPNEKTQEQINAQFESELKRMRERERRTLLRLAAKDARPIGHNDSLTDESDDHVSPDSHSSDGASTDIRTRLAEIRVEAIPLESEGNNDNLG